MNKGADRKRGLVRITRQEQEQEQEQEPLFASLPVINAATSISRAHQSTAEQLRTQRTQGGPQAWPGLAWPES